MKNNPPQYGFATTVDLALFLLGAPVLFGEGPCYPHLGITLALPSAVAALMLIVVFGGMADCRGYPM